MKLCNHRWHNDTTIAGYIKRWISRTYLYRRGQQIELTRSRGLACIKTTEYALQFGRVGALRLTGSRYDGWNGLMKLTIPTGNPNGRYIIILWRFGVKVNVGKPIGHHNNNSECPNMMINTSSLTKNVDWKELGLSNDINSIFI